MKSYLIILLLLISSSCQPTINYESLTNISRLQLENYPEIKSQYLLNIFKINNPKFSIPTINKLNNRIAYTISNQPLMQIDKQINVTDKNQIETFNISDKAPIKLDLASNDNFSIVIYYKEQISHNQVNIALYNQEKNLLANETIENSAWNVENNLLESRIIEFINQNLPVYGYIIEVRGENEAGILSIGSTSGVTKGKRFAIIDKDNRSILQMVKINEVYEDTSLVYFDKTKSAVYLGAKLISLPK